MTAMDAATEVIAIIMVDDRNKNQVPPIATLTAIVLPIAVTVNISLGVWTVVLKTSLSCVVAITEKTIEVRIKILTTDTVTRSETHYRMVVGFTTSYAISAYPH
jgi:hypothetical protein